MTLASSVPGLTQAENSIDINDFASDGAPDDEKYWKQIAKKYYAVNRNYINLENGYYGIQPRPVLAAFQKKYH